MRLSSLLSPERVSCDAEPASKKRALEELSTLIANAEGSLTRNEIFDSLLSRERLGSTGLGHGVAIPHGRVKSADRTVGAFVRLHRPIDYDAVDNQPVDLLFALLVPENSTDEHLQTLARLAEMFSDSELLERLRQAEDPGTIFELLEHWDTKH